MFYDYFESGLIGILTLVGDDAGLRRVVFPEERNRVDILADWKQKRGVFTKVEEQLRSYFNGELKEFDVRLAPEGTPFQLKVWEALRGVPYGQLVTYKGLAEAIGAPKAARAVGGANGKNPIPIITPCHRCIGSDGKLTGFGGGLETKRRLIELERAHTSRPRSSR